MEASTLYPHLYTKSDAQKKMLEAGSRYLIIRKDGKSHLETYNGTGFAYNDNVIKYFYLPKTS